MKRLVLFYFVILMTSNNVDLWAAEESKDSLKKGLTETFKIKGCEDADLVALTGRSGGLFKNFPPSIKPLDDPTLAGVLGVFSKLRNSSGEIMGFASEVEELASDAEGIYSKSEWTLKIPGRGALFSTQVERFKKLFEEIDDMKRKGEKERYYSVPLKIMTTMPGSGSLIGGTGEFSGATGLFNEVDEFKYISLATGSICVDITLEVLFDLAKEKKK